MLRMLGGASLASPLAKWKSTRRGTENNSFLNDSLIDLSCIMPVYSDNLRLRQDRIDFLLSGNPRYPRKYELSN